MSTFRGNAQTSSGPVTGTIFTLPSGDRPAKNLYFAVYGSEATAAYVQVASNGDVSEFGVAQDYVGLSNISFRAGLYVEYRSGAEGNAAPRQSPICASRRMPAIEVSGRRRAGEAPRGRPRCATGPRQSRVCGGELVRLPEGVTHEGASWTTLDQVAFHLHSRLPQHSRELRGVALG